MPITRKLLWLPACLLLAPADCLPDDSEAKHAHIVDSATDRTPAKTAFPKYPRIARRDRIEGNAVVCFRIDKFGHIYSIRLASATHRIFRRPVLRAIRDSEYEPLAPDELLARGRTCRTYRFRLEPVVVANDDKS